MNAVPKTPTRIYSVRDKAGSERLVRAPSQAQAINHCVRSDYKAEVASQDVLVAAMQSGTQVEDARESATASE